MIKANVLGRKVPNENMHYTCIACNYHWSCYENRKEKLSAGLFKRMQIQNKENADIQIHKHWARIRIRIRIRIRHWINGKIKIWFWHWIIVIFLLIVILDSGLLLWTSQKLASHFDDFERVKNVVVILLTLSRSKN